MPRLVTALEPPSAMVLASVGEILDFLPLLVVLVANLAVLDRGPRPSARWFWPVLSGVGAAILLLGLGSLSGNPGSGLGLAIGGALTVALALPAARQVVARVLPIDPGSPLDVTAVALTAVIACSQLGLQVGGAALASVTAAGPETLVDQLLNELPLLLGGLLGVGIFLRRTPMAALGRLGVVVPRGWEVLLGLTCAGAFFAFAAGAQRLQQWLTPGVAARVGATTGLLYQQLHTPQGILTLALAPAICEETLFRGALQPRLGLIWTSLVFALLHTQYGLSIDEVAVMILALGLGLLRRFTNTTTSMICHAVYNGLTAASLGASFLIAGVAAEAVLLGALGLWALRVARRSRPVEVADDL